MLADAWFRNLWIFVNLVIFFIQHVFSGGIPRIQKASAEEFIHIFVNNSPKLTEFLEHMIKVYIATSKTTVAPLIWGHSWTEKVASLKGTI